MVFYDNHAASAKQINLFHAFYPHCRQLQERGTCYWKACFTDTVREQSDITYIFWNNGLFPTTALAFVPFALVPCSWLGSDIIPLSSRRKQSLESGCLGGVSIMLTGPVDIQGEVMVFSFSLLRASNSKFVRRNACLQSRDPVCWYLWCLMQWHTWTGGNGGTYAR